MKFIIGNKRYDTDKAEFITRYRIGSSESTLYVTAKGNYFFTVTDCIRGGTLGEKCSKEEAIKFTKRYNHYQLKKFFPEVLEEIEEA
jgi:hypothetical protein